MEDQHGREKVDQNKKLIGSRNIKIWRGSQEILLVLFLFHSTSHIVPDNRGALESIYNIPLTEGQ